MAGKCYYITSERRRWQFEVDGEQYGPYSTERDAIAAATVEARQALRDGSPEAQILARSAGGAWQVRWDSRTAPPET